MKKAQVARPFAYVTGNVNQQLLLRNEYLLVNAKTKLSVRLPRQTNRLVFAMHRHINKSIR